MSPHDELIAVLHDGKELGFTYDEIDEIIKALERAKKMEELLELYRKAHIDVLNGELAYQIEALEEELK